MIERDVKICEKCKLYKDSRVLKPCMSGQYSMPQLHMENKQCDVMVVVESPEEDDERRNIVFSDNVAGVQLRKALNDFGASDYYITNIVKCKSMKGNSTKETQAPPPAIIKSCNAYYKSELETIKPKVVLLLGNSALVGALKHSGISKYHGSPCKDGDTTYMATYNPLSFYHNKKFVKDFMGDINIFGAIVKSKGDISTIAEPVAYNYVNTMPMVIQMFREMKRAGVFSFDIECPGLNPWNTRRWTVVSKDNKIPYEVNISPVKIDGNILHFKVPPSVTCISFSTKPNTGWVLPLDHSNTPFSPSELVEIKKVLKVILEDASLKKIGQNCKFDSLYLQAVLGIKTKGIIFDTMLAAYLLNEEGGEYGLKDLALRHTDMGDYDAELTKARKKIVPKSEEYNYSLIPMRELFHYSACDADATIRLYHLFKDLLQKEDLLPVMDLLLIISGSVTQAEINGAKIDIPYVENATREYWKKIEAHKATMRAFQDIKDVEEYYTYRDAFYWMRDAFAKDQEIRKTQDALFEVFPAKLLDMDTKDFFQKFDKFPFKNRLSMYARLYTAYPHLFRKMNHVYFNFNSTFHLRDLIYGYLGEKVLKKTDKGEPSTDEETIKIFAKDHAVLNEVAQHKKYTKFYSTYLAPVITDWLCEDGLIHTNYKVHGTVTGRLASQRPNMQNLPRDDKVVKNMFVSRFNDGWILNVDYSQIELRILAVYSRDSKLIDFYNRGLDLHSQTAAEILNKPINLVTEDERQIFKAVNFLIVYGGTPRALAVKTGISEEKAQNFMDHYFEAFPGVTQYIKNFREYATSHKYIRTLTDRKRRLPNVDSEKEWVREEALRMAINTPIQSTASDITQTSMARLQDEITERRFNSLIIGTVHDSIMIDTYPTEITDVYDTVKIILENPTFKFCKNDDGSYIVPYKCDIGIGRRYGETKELIKENNSFFVVEKRNKVNEKGEVEKDEKGKDKTVKVNVPFEEFLSTH